MINAWVEYRLHLNALFSTLPRGEQYRLLALLQKAEVDWSKPATTVTEPVAEGEKPAAKATEPAAEGEKPAPGVIWDGSRGRWRVRRQRGASARVYGRFTQREEAEALARAICAYERDNGHSPPAGWRG